MAWVKRPQLLYKGRGQYVVFRPGLYEGGYEKFHIRPGFKTDLATRPGILRWFIDKEGVHEDCAILHDQNLYDLYAGRYTTTSSDIDGLFRRMLREDGVPFVKRWLMWTAVRWGAVINTQRRKGISRDLPMMLFISLLAAPVIVPVTLVAVLGMAVYWLIERFLGLFIKN